MTANNMIAVALASALLCCAAAAADAPVTVENAEALYPNPGEETRLRLALPEGSDCIVTDLHGAETGRGTTVGCGVPGRSELRLSLPRGWYELRFPASGITAGIAVTPDALRTEYWNIDAGLTWSHWPPERKLRTVEALRRKGIATFRERMSWPQTEQEEFRGDTRAVRDALYRGDALELVQDSPASFRRGDRKNSFDLDFTAAADGIRRMEEQLGAAWNAVELWNEPFFNNALPADQYLPVAKLLSARLNAPVTGGSFSPAIPHAYFTMCLDSGFADILDALSLHFYGSPESMAETVGYYRTHLEKAGRGGIPLWITESGTPGASELRSAVNTTMRAVECRSLGAERFYAFYLQHHNEGRIAWGMTDAAGTPNRSLAVYLAAASLIGGKPYLGDAHVQGDVSLVRGFADSSGGVLVLYGKPGAELKLPVRPDKFAGADGRELPVTGEFFRNTDGLGYALYAPGRLETFVRRAPAAPVRTGKARKRPTVVLQLPYPAGAVLSHSNNGYTVVPEAAERFKATVRCNNLADAPVTGKLTAAAPGVSMPPREVTIPAKGCVEEAFELNFRAALERDGECLLRFGFESADGGDRIVQRFQRPATVRAERMLFTDGGSPAWDRAAAFRDTTVRSDAPGGAGAPPEEFGCEGKFLWSDLGIHFRVTVRDPRHDPSPDDGTSWMYDSLQLAVSQYNSANDHNRFEWGFRLDAEGRPHKITFLSSTGKPLSEASAVTIRRDDAARTTVYEGLIAWNDLGSMNAVYDRRMMRLRMTFCVNDFNNGNRRWSEWTPGIAQEKNPDTFVEFTLVSGERESVEIPLKRGTYRGDRQHCAAAPGGALKLNDAKNGALEFAVDPVALDAPVTLRFDLAATEWEKHNGTGFCFGAELRDSGTNEAYQCFLAPHTTFGGSSGCMLREKEAPAPVIGKEKSTFSPSGLFHTVELTVDSGAREFELALTPPKGEREVVAKGPIRRNTMRSFDRIIFTTSGWGAGPFLLKNVRIVR